MSALAVAATEDGHDFLFFVFFSLRFFFLLHVAHAVTRRPGRACASLPVRIRLCCAPRGRGKAGRCTILPASVALPRQRFPSSVRGCCFLCEECDASLRRRVLDGTACLRVLPHRSHATRLHCTSTPVLFCADVRPRRRRLDDVVHLNTQGACVRRAACGAAGGVNAAVACPASCVLRVARRERFASARRPALWNKPVWARRDARWQRLECRALRSAICVRAHCVCDGAAATARFWLLSPSSQVFRVLRLFKSPCGWSATCRCVWHQERKERCSLTFSSSLLPAQTVPGDGDLAVGRVGGVARWRRAVRQYHRALLDLLILVTSGCWLIQHARQTPSLSPPRAWRRRPCPWPACRTPSWQPRRRLARALMWSSALAAC